MPIPSNYATCNKPNDPVVKHHPTIRLSIIAKLYELYGQLDPINGKVPSFNKIINAALDDLVSLKTSK
jgi:hypothetical protein